VIDVLQQRNPLDEYCVMAAAVAIHEDQRSNSLRARRYGP